MIALSPLTTRHFIPKCDAALPPEEQTVFVLRPLMPADQALLDNEMGEITDGAYRLKLGGQALLALHLGLAEVRNLKDADGGDVVLTRVGPTHYGRYQEISEEFLSRIPKDIRDEVSAEIRKSASLGEADRKN